MAVTSGFFNAINGDRRYDAIQMSSLFDGIILDGVFQNYLEALRVSEFSEDLAALKIQVAPGRAWFNHSWTYNDTILLLDIEAPELILDRIDSVVIDVFTATESRKNDIIIIKGDPATNPTPPVLIKEEGHWQYPIANVLVKSGAAAITQANIENRIGTEDCPFVRAPLEKMTIDFLISQWQGQWVEQLQSWTDEWTGFYEGKITEIEDFQQYFTSDLTDYFDEKKSEFDVWFFGLKETLTTDVAANLSQQIFDMKHVIQVEIPDFVDDEGITRDVVEIAIPGVKSTDLVRLFVSSAIYSLDDMSADEISGAIKQDKKKISMIDGIETDDGILRIFCFNKHPRAFTACLAGSGASI